MLLKNLDPSSKDQIKLYRFQYSTLTAVLVASLITVYICGYGQAAIFLSIGSIITFSKLLSITSLTTMELEKLHLSSIGHDAVQEHIGNLFIKQGTIYNYQARSINSLLLASRHKKIAEKISAKAACPTTDEPFTSDLANSADIGLIDPLHSPQPEDEVDTNSGQFEDRPEANFNQDTSSDTDLDDIEGVHIKPEEDNEKN